MSFLSAAQSAAIRLVGRRPESFFSTQNKFELEICDLANEVAADLVKAHEWRLLTKLMQMNGDGSTVGFDMPADFDRFPMNGSIHPRSWTTWTYTPTRDLDEWTQLTDGMTSVSPGFWIVLGGQMQFHPPVTAGEIAQFWYISNRVVLDQDGITTKAGFTSDEDSLRLNERLLTLGLIWRWKSQKGLQYAEDMANYEKALAEAIGPDKGPRVLRDRPASWPLGTRIAYPGTLG